MISQSYRHMPLRYHKENLVLMDSSLYKVEILKDNFHMLYQMMQLLLI